MARVLGILLNVARVLGWCLAGGFLVWLCDIGITCLAALRSYTLLGISGCIVKFSFLLTFSAEIVFIKKVLLSFRFYIARPSNSYLPLLVKPLVFCGTVGASGVACAAARILAFSRQ